MKNKKCGNPIHSLLLLPLLFTFSLASGAPDGASMIRIQTAVDRLRETSAEFGREIELQTVSAHLELGIEGIWNGIVAAVRKWSRSDEYEKAANAFLASQNELLTLMDEVLADPLTSDEEKRGIYLLFHEWVSGDGTWSADESGEGLRRTLTEAYEKALSAWRQVDPETKDCDAELLQTLEKIVRRTQHLLDSYAFIISETESLKKAQESATSNAIAFIEGRGQMLSGAIESFNRFLTEVRKDQEILRGELEARAGETKNYDLILEVLVSIVDPVLEGFEGIEEIPNGFFSQLGTALAFNHRALKLQLEATLQQSPLFRLWSGEDSKEEEILPLLIQAQEQTESANFAITLATISLNQKKTPLTGSHIFEGLRVDPLAIEAVLGVEEGIGGMANFILTLSSLVGKGEFLEAGKQLLWAPIGIFLPFWGITDEAVQAHLNQVALFGITQLSDATGGWAGIDAEEVVQITDAEIEELQKKGEYHLTEDQFNPYRLAIALVAGGVTLKIILKPAAILRHGIVETVIYQIVKKKIGPSRFAAEIRTLTLEQIKSMSPNQILELVGLNLRGPRTGRLTLMNWKFLAEKIRAELIRLAEERITVRDSLSAAIRNIDQIAPMTKEMEAREAYLKSILDRFQQEVQAVSSTSRWRALRNRIVGLLSWSRRVSKEQIVNHVMERGIDLIKWKENLIERSQRGEKITLEEMVAFTLVCEPKFAPLFGRAAAWVQFREVAANLLPQKYPQVFRHFLTKTARLLLPERNIQDIASLTEALYPLPEAMRDAVSPPAVRPYFWRRGPRRFAQSQIIHEARTQLLRLWLIDGLRRAGIDFKSLLTEQVQSLRARNDLSRLERRRLQNMEQFLELSRRYEESFRNTDFDVFAADAEFEKALDLTRLESRFRDFGSEWWGRNFRWVAWGTLTAILFDLVDSLEQRSLDQEQYSIEHPDYREASAGQKIVIESQRFSEERRESETLIDELEAATPHLLRHLIRELEEELAEETDPKNRAVIEEDLRWCREQSQK